MLERCPSRIPSTIRLDQYCSKPSIMRLKRALTVGSCSKTANWLPNGKLTKGYPEIGIPRLRFQEIYDVLYKNHCCWLKLYTLAYRCFGFARVNHLISLVGTIHYPWVLTTTICPNFLVKNFSLKIFSLKKLK